MASRQTGICVLNASGLGVNTGVVVPTPATSKKETSITNMKLQDVAKDVQEVTKLVELLVRRERKADMRLEKETDEQNDEEHEASLTDNSRSETEIAQSLLADLLEMLACVYIYVQLHFTPGQEFTHTLPQLLDASAAQPHAFSVLQEFTKKLSCCSDLALN